MSDERADKFDKVFENVNAILDPRQAEAGAGLQRGAQ